MRGLNDGIGVCGKTPTSSADHLANKFQMVHHLGADTIQLYVPEIPAVVGMGSSKHSFVRLEAMACQPVEARDDSVRLQDIFTSASKTSVIDHGPLGDAREALVQHAELHGDEDQGG